MARKSNHVTVVFLQDYATKKVGEEWACDGMLASSLVQRKVAKYKTDVVSSVESEATAEDNNTEKVSLPSEKTAGEAEPVKESGKQKPSPKSKSKK